ncbi:restriction endonuclease subunit S [Capnocytophaga cynodegmi]|uniref:restriction endonuclease subunit S n=1 Tax=Capnocytophaga cynodegmi TaxID=28189 RepID=UPI0038591C44
MITKNNFKQLLTHLGFAEHKSIFTKKINEYELKVDFKTENLIYPDGLTAHRDTTKNFSQPENFVVFECVHNLLQSGYKPEHIILEQGMPGGHGMTGGFCDIIVQDNNEKPYLLIECKTADDKKSKEFSKAWNKMLKDGGQLFNYYNSYRQAMWICLYTADFDEETQKHSSLYHLISMQDNEEYLQTNSHFRSFKEVADANSGKEEFFKVWKDTYQCDFISHNLFESEIFKVGNRPFGIADLKMVDGDAIAKKYHQFATIMRQHNVSGRENAFDKLVNLFLCKVVDENKNPNNLKVYWKGAASDDHFSLQDRLQKLYKVGMFDFLGEDVTYIEESEIENAFKFFKNKKDETKKTILDYFKQLKFYSNNAFAFLDVHNENLFLQNAVILKEVVQMLQDIRLKNEGEQHQFLGDLFEGFLDQGVKQSEGQFFTPMPIVKFLISSLPLEQILQSEATPKVIDYACGAGHFLTEYASQVKDIIGKNETQILKNHYENIYGIEKEYRLSKVAKVSAFMYGQDQINIIYSDALAKNSRIKNNDFNVLVANPPYSVKGFLVTLSDEDKQAFDLYDNLSEDSFNSIETFFVEKAKQLLKTDGVAAIILPSSILTNGNIYIKCREIILKYFDLVAIAEFGSGTFGKTGTNTATLFLRRKEQKPDIAEHYKNRVEEWFKGDFNIQIQQIFADEHLLQNYCTHCGLDFSEYKKFLQGQGNTIFQNEIFADYKKEFDNSTETKKRKNQPSFKKSSKDKQEEILTAELTKFIKEKEQEKVYFYLLAQDNKSEVLIVKSPADNKAMKTFLGYEWSSAKGNEGIKYLGTTTTDEDEAINRNKGIFQIQTPLFNPNKLSDDGKINTYIRKHFMGESFTISEENKVFVSLLPLTDMLDFSRTSFDKALRTSVQKKIEVKSKYPLVKLGDVTEILSGGTPDTKNSEYWNNGTICWATLVDTKNKYLTDTQRKITQKGLSESSAKLLPINTVIFSSRATIGEVTIAKVETSTNQGYKNFICNERKINYLYLYYILKDQAKNIEEIAGGMTYKEISKTDLSNFKIPLPPLPIQEQIVAECEKIDQEYENSRMSIEAYRGKIAQIFHELQVLEKTEWGG